MYGYPRNAKYNSLPFTIRSPSAKELNLSCGFCSNSPNNSGIDYELSVCSNVYTYQYPIQLEKSQHCKTLSITLNSTANTGSIRVRLKKYNQDNSSDSYEVVGGIDIQYLIVSNEEKEEFIYALNFSDTVPHIKNISSRVDEFNTVARDYWSSSNDGMTCIFRSFVLSTDDGKSFRDDKKEWNNTDHDLLQLLEPSSTLPIKAAALRTLSSTSPAPAPTVLVPSSPPIEPIVPLSPTVSAPVPTTAAPKNERERENTTEDYFQEYYYIYDDNDNVRVRGRLSSTVSPTTTTTTTTVTVVENYDFDHRDDGESPTTTDYYYYDDDDESLKTTVATENTVGDDYYYNDEENLENKDRDRLSTSSATATTTTTTMNTTTTTNTTKIRKTTTTVVPGINEREREDTVVDESGNKFNPVVAEKEKTFMVGDFDYNQVMLILMILIVAKLLLVMCVAGAGLCALCN